MQRESKIIILVCAVFVAAYLGYCIFVNHQKVELAQNPDAISCVDSTVTGGRLYRVAGKNTYDTPPFNREELYLTTRESESKYFDITFLYSTTNVRVDLNDHTTPVKVCYLKKFPKTVVDAYYTNLSLSTDTYDIFNADENFGWNIVLLIIIAIITPIILSKKVVVAYDRSQALTTGAKASFVFKWLAILFFVVFMFGIILAAVIG